MKNLPVPVYLRPLEDGGTSMKVRREPSGTFCRGAEDLETLIVMLLVCMDEHMEALLQICCAGIGEAYWIAGSGDEHGVLPTGVLCLGRRPVRREGV